MQPTKEHLDGLQYVAQSLRNHGERFRLLTFDPRKEVVELLAPAVRQMGQEFDEMSKSLNAIAEALK